MTINSYKESKERKSIPDWGQLFILTIDSIILCLDYFTDTVLNKLKHADIQTYTLQITIRT